MSESPGPAGMDMETVLTRAVKKFFKWQLSGLSGTLIVAAMLWFLVFFFFFLILVFVMCVEYHYDKRERQDAELALPKDEEKKWAEPKTSRETSKTSLKRVAPIPMPPLPVTKDEPMAFVSEKELEPAEEPLARQEESPTEAITEESVIVDAPADEVAPRSPSPPQAEEPEPEESPEADEEQPPPEEEAVENTQDEADDTVVIEGDDNDDAAAPAAEPESEEPPPETETQEEDNTVAEEGGDDENPDASTVPPEETEDVPAETDNANAEAGSPSKASIHSKKGED